MRIPKAPFRAWLSGVLTLALASTFSLSSFAASGAGTATDDAILDSVLVSQAPTTGTLTAHGPVIVNGNEAKTGATITDGNVIQTRTGGHAMIELGALGRVELDPITAITLCFMNHVDPTMPASIQASLDKCGQGVTLFLPAGVGGVIKILNMTDVGVLNKDREVDVRVFKGEAVVKYGQGKEKILKAGDHKEFDNATEVVSTGDAVVKAYCLEDHYPLWLWAGLAAIFIPELFGEEPPALSQLNPVGP